MALKETHELTRDNLFAASQVMPVVADALSIPSGAFTRGTLVTAAGAAVTSAGDVYAVLAEDVDASAGAKVAAVYLTGEFNAAALVADGDLPVADCKAAARKIGIFIK